MMNVIQGYRNLAPLAKIAVGGCLAVMGACSIGSTDRVVLVAMAALGQAAAWFPHMLRRDDGATLGALAEDIQMSVALERSIADSRRRAPVATPEALSEDDQMRLAIMRSLEPEEIAEDLALSMAIEASLLGGARAHQRRAPQVKEPLAQPAQTERAQCPYMATLLGGPDDAALIPPSLALRKKDREVCNAAVFLLTLLTKGQHPCEAGASDMLGHPIDPADVADAARKLHIDCTQFLNIWTRVERPAHLGGIQHLVPETQATLRTNERVRLFKAMLTPGDATRFYTANFPEVWGA